MMLVGNGTVLTFDANMAKVDKGCVAIENGVIVEVGKTNALRAAYPKAEFIDAKGHVILPGWINVHHHIYSAFARGMSLGGPPAKGMLDVLEGLWWRLDKALTLEDVTYSAYVTLIDCIRNGVTTVFDHHAGPYSAKGSLFAIGDVVNTLGLRASLALEVSDRDGLDVADTLIQENLDWLRACRERQDDRLKGLFGLHAPFTLGDRTLTRCAERIDARDGYHVHVCEGSLDPIDSMEKYQMQVMDRLDKFGILRSNTTAVHCIAVPDEGFDLLAQRDACVAHNPQSNMNNAVGCARVLDMAQRGITVGLGTDGYTSDVLESYKTAPILQRLCLKDPSAGFLETADMLLRGNAAIAARSFDRPLGVLAPGAWGDVIIMDYDPPTPLLDSNQIGHILFGLTGRMVDTTIAGGRVLMRDRQIEAVDTEAIHARAREVAQALWRRI